MEMVREGCRAAEVWRVSELRRLGGAGLREAVESSGALEGLVGKGKVGKTWEEVVGRVAQVRGGRVDAKLLVNKPQILKNLRKFHFGL